MNTIYWIMGGTAVGKKYLIKSVASAPLNYGFDPSVVTAWMPDGEMSVMDLVALAEESSLLVRWQWKREGHITHIATHNKNIRQVIYLCRAYPSVQMERVESREGVRKWDERAIMNEARDVEDLAERLSEEYAIPIYFVRHLDKYERKDGECEDTDT